MHSSLIRKALPHLIAIGLFLIIALLYCKPVLEGKVINQSDVIQWKAMAQQSIEFKEKYGHYPLWTESAFSGMPAYTIAMNTPTITAGYLSYILTLGLPKPINYLFLACICFYILSQVLRINPYIGILASIGYAYSTFDPVIIAVGHDSQMAAIAYAPAVVASLLLIYQRRYLLGGALFGIFFGFQISTTHFQIVYYTLIMMGILSLAYFIYCWQGKELRHFFISVLIAIVAGILAFGTAANSILPFQEYSKETKRGGKSELSSNTGSTDKTAGGLDKSYAFQWSYGIGETLTLVVPGVYGGGSEGSVMTGSSKYGDKAAELGMSEDNAMQFANAYDFWYWGNQPNTAGPVYLGAAMCFLFLFALVFLRSWHLWWIIPTAILGIVLAWGSNFSSFNYFMFDHFPFYSKFRAPTQALFMPQLVFPLLAALGVDSLLQSRVSKPEIWQKFQKAVYIAGGLIIILAVFYFSADYKSPKDAGVKETFANNILQSSRGKQPSQELQQQATSIATALVKALQEDRQSIFGGDLIRSILIIAALVILMGLYLKDKIKPAVLIGGLLLVSSYDLLAEGRLYLNDDHFSEPADFDASIAPTPADLAINKDPDKNGRVLDASTDWYQSSHASFYHNSLGGYSPAKLGLYQDIIDSQLVKGNQVVYDMLNTRYIIRRNPANGQDQAIPNPGAFGPCWLVQSIHFVKDGNQEMKALDSINVRDTAIVQDKFKPVIRFTPVPDSSASIRLIQNLNDKITYKSSAKTNQFAVFSEVYYDKGWNAFLDGNKVDYCRVDYILRGMPVPSGDHTIEFRFEPSGYSLGNMITGWSSILIMILLVAAAGLEWKSRRKNSAEPGESHLS